MRWLVPVRFTELPCIQNERAYITIDPTLSDWRISCFFSGKGYCGKGAAYAALKGAVDWVEKLGGGRIKGYPEDTEGRKASPAFLVNQGFSEPCFLGRTLLDDIDRYRQL